MSIFELYMHAPGMYFCDSVHSLVTFFLLTLLFVLILVATSTIYTLLLMISMFDL